MKLRKLTEDDVVFTITCEPEDMPLKGAFDDDGESEALIRKQLAAGNEWAWCVVTVTVEWEHFKGRDILGGCSYESEEDFKKDAYFADMKHVALEQLNDSISEAMAKLGKLVVS